MTLQPVPVDLCVGQRELTEPRLSPDGSHLGWMSAQAGAVALVIEHLASGIRREHTLDAGLRGARSLGGGSWCWLPDGRTVIAVAADGSLWRLCVLGDGAVGDEVVGDGFVAGWVDSVPVCWWSPGEGRSVWSPWAADVADLGVVVVCTVEQAQVWATDGRSSWRLDDGRADFVADPCLVDNQAWWTAWDVPAMPWDESRLESVRVDGSSADDTVARTAIVGSAAVQQARPHPDGRMTCIRDDHGWNNVWFDGRPLIGEVYEHAGPAWGPGARTFAWSPDGSRLAFTRNDDGFGRLCVWEGGEVTEVGRGVHGQLSWQSNMLAALRSGARTPTEVVVYDTDTWVRRSFAVGPDAAWQERRDRLVEPEPWMVGDVHARLYRAADDGTTPAATSRAIIWLHGGPTDQWQVTFMPRIEYWRSRGWHVVVPDHHGSTGHGRDYMRALRGGWGELDVRDTIAVIEAIHGRDMATPATTVVFGGSAGGFTALETACRRPDLMAAVAVSYPVTDLADLAERSHRFEAHYTVGLVGPLPDTRALHEARSPVHHPERVRDVPVLILHGAADPVVPVDHSRAFAAAARATDADVTLHEYPSEGHGFRDAANQRDEYLRIEAFLERVVPAGQG